MTKKKEEQLDARERIAANLSSMREESGFTQKDVADAIGSFRQRVCAFERGTRTPSLETLDLLAEFFEVDIADFFVA